MYINLFIGFWVVYFDLVINVFFFVGGGFFLMIDREVIVFVFCGGLFFIFEYDFIIDGIIVKIIV